MSIVEREIALAEEGDIDAEPLEEEFDNIVGAINSLFALDEVSGTETQVLGGSYADVVGATESITVTVPSKLLVWVSAEFNMPLSEALGKAVLNVDGSDRTKTANYGGTDVRGSGSQFYVVSLAAGAHTIKLRAKSEGAGTNSIVGANSGFTYLRLPEP